MEGLTIAFICSGLNHPTVQNYHLFGSQFWDDCKSNKSKKGYYFAYYFQKKFVRIHRIVDLFTPDQKPVEMRDWNTTRQILGLTPPLKQFTWDEWIHGIGKGSPYATDYHSTQTGSWSIHELHTTFPTFDFERFKLDVQSPHLVHEEIPTEEILIPTEEILTEENLTEEIPNEENLHEEDIDKDVELLKQINQRVVRNTLEGICRLRQEYATVKERKIEEVLTSIESLNQQLYRLEHEKKEILEGSMDSMIVAHETETKMNQFIQDYL